MAATRLPPSWLEDDLPMQLALSLSLSLVPLSLSRSLFCSLVFPSLSLSSSCTPDIHGHTRYGVRASAVSRICFSPPISLLPSNPVKHNDYSIKLSPLRLGFDIPSERGSPGEIANNVKFLIRGRSLRDASRSYYENVIFISLRDITPRCIYLFLLSFFFSFCYYLAENTSRSFTCVRSLERAVPSLGNSAISAIHTTMRRIKILSVKLAYIHRRR